MPSHVRPKRLSPFLTLCLLALTGRLAYAENYVQSAASPGSFPIVQAGETATILVDARDWPGVTRAAGDLQADIERVTSKKPALAQAAAPAKNVILVGTLGKSPLIDQLVKDGKLDAKSIAGKWESYVLQTVANPLPGVDSALVIAGSDKRGAIYGIYELSQNIGVSPWYWWADVPTTHQDNLFIKAGRYEHGEPSVKYRGIFFNDEAPDLTNWVRAKFGNVTAQNNPKAPQGVNGPANYGREFYTKVFELLLRLHGNYMWPAMWNNSFNEDDPENPKLADMYGIVMGTSHQEPMLRAQKEWDWGPGKQPPPLGGNWNYNNQQQRPALENFWREGARRNKDYESIFTMGLRAENDSGTPIGKDLTEQIVGVQRKILSEEVNTDITKVPQMWCLYKEVQGFYEQGLRVPDDITLLWAEDNWGNIRRLPTEEERKRPGGAGIYYHFDYHGGPRSYQWINTSPISKIYDQMSLAKAYGADRIWIVNVGHFKGYELPTEFFLNLGWDANAVHADTLNQYTRDWAARQFGPEHAAEIADILAKYTKFNGRRKPELLDASTYSVVDYQEFDTVVADYKALAAQAQALSEKIPPLARDAYYELVLFPTLASAQVNELYLAAAKNDLYARQGRASAADYAAQAQALFQADADLMTHFNKTFINGKWDHFMDQSHIGYTSWQDPPQNNMNAIRLSQVTLPEAPALAVATEGNAAAWPAFTPTIVPLSPAGGGNPRGGAGRAGPGRAGPGRGAATAPSGLEDRQLNPVLLMFDAFNQQKRFIDVFNRGRAPFDFTATASDPWITVSAPGGKVEKESRLWVSIDWAKAPKPSASGRVTIKSAAGADIPVTINIFNPADITRDTLQGFIESQHFISIEAEHFTRNFSLDGFAAPRWTKIDDYGKTLSAMSIQPPNAASILPPTATSMPATLAPCLEYRIYMLSPHTATVTAYLAPTLNFVPGRGLRYAVSFDDRPPQLVTAVPANFSAQNGNANWETTVKDSIRLSPSDHDLLESGYHTLKIWMVDPGIVLEKIVIDLGGVRPTYLGPPESFHRIP